VRQVRKYSKPDRSIQSLSKATIRPAYRRAVEGSRHRTGKAQSGIALRPPRARYQRFAQLQRLGEIGACGANPTTVRQTPSGPSRLGRGSDLRKKETQIQRCGSANQKANRRFHFGKAVSGKSGNSTGTNGRLSRSGFAVAALPRVPLQRPQRDPP
jgi:hypothetical protein